MYQEKMVKLLPVGSIMRKDDYLPLTDRKLVDVNIYDTMAFISIHCYDKKWSLHAPLFIIPDNGERPDWERDKFDSFTEALMRAVELSLEYETFVVIVDDPITGKTMQPSRSFPQV